MATIDATGSLRNNEKRFTQVAIGKIKETMPGGVALVANDVYQVAVIPPNSIVTSAIARVTSAGTSAGTADIIIGSTTVFDDLPIDTAATTESTVVTPAAVIGVTTASQVVSITPTVADVDMEVWVEYIEDATTGMYAAVQ